MSMNHHIVCVELTVGLLLHSGSNIGTCTCPQSKTPELISSVNKAVVRQFIILYVKRFQRQSFLSLRVQLVSCVASLPIIISQHEETQQLESVKMTLKGFLDLSSGRSGVYDAYEEIRTNAVLLSFFQNPGLPQIVQHL